MGVVIFIAFWAVALALYGMFAKDKTREEWEEAGRRMGLTLAGRFGLSGALDAHPVSILATSGKNAHTRFTVGVALPAGFRLAREGFGSSVGKLLMGEDVATGDRDFDAAVLIRGEEIEAVGMLTSEIRALMQEALEYDVKIGGNEIVADRSGVVSNAAALEKITRLLVKLARALGAQSRLRAFERLSHVAAHDRLPPVRRRALELLLRSPGRESTEASERALKDSDPANRLLAAVRLSTSGKGIDVLAALAKELDTPDDVRLGALKQLARISTREKILPFFENALKDRSADVRIAGIAGFGRLKHKPAVARFIAIAAKTDPKTRAAMASALGEIGDSAAEPALIEMLEAADVEVQIAAARALGLLGGKTAVEPLRTAADVGLLGSGELRKVANSAVDQIQSRLQGAGAGQLSVADDGQEGKLSVAGEEGALSIAKKQRTPQGTGNA